MAKFFLKKIDSVSLNMMPAVWQVERLNGADSSVETDGTLGVWVDGSCKVAQMEEVQLGTDWRAGDLSLLCLISLSFFL